VTKISESKYRNLYLGAALVVLTFCAYLPATQAGFVWDDDRYVTENPLLVVPDGLSRIWFSTDQPSQYFPLVYTVFRIEHALWGFAPVGYHLFNIVFHVINALLVWHLLKRVNMPAAFAAALIFALHPVQVESVAWITELKNVLMLFFSLLSLWAWLGWAERFERSQRARGLYMLSLCAYSLALLSKTTACTLPAALVLLPWLKGLRLHRGFWLRITPYLFFGLIMGSITLWWEHCHQGLHPLVNDLNPVERMLVACRALWFYLGKLAWPLDLSFSYPRWEVNAGDLKQYVWVLAWLVTGGLLWRFRNRLGRGPLAATLFFVATLLPMLGLISLYTFLWSFVADHYQYMASIGPIALAVAIGCRIVDRFRGRAGQAAKIMALAVPLVLGVMTFHQTRIYRNGETLWRDTLQKNPSSWMAHVNLGAELGSQGREDEAYQHYLAALEIFPDSEHACYNLGNILMGRGLIEEAVEYFNQSLRINPDFVLVYNNLGLALSDLGRKEEAIEQYRLALEKAPGTASVHHNLAIVLAETGRTAEALVHFQKVVHLHPGSPSAHYDLGEALRSLGRNTEAIERFRIALEMAINTGEEDLCRKIRERLGEKIGKK